MFRGCGRDKLAKGRKLQGMGVAYLTSPFFSRSMSTWMPSIHQVSDVAQSGCKAEAGQTDLR
jgi:hypothetical protein